MQPFGKPVVPDVYWIITGSDGSGSASSPSKPLAALSRAQLEVLRLVAQGYTNDYIAQTKGTSRSSVERWLTEIFRLLDIDTHGHLNPRVEAARAFIS